MRFHLSAGAGIAALFCISAAHAARPVINIPVQNGIFDMVYDTQRGVLYMTTGAGNVLRFSLASQSFLSPLTVQGNLLGLDISADTNSLCIADFNSGNNMVWVDVYDLTSNQATKIYGTGGSNIAGTYDAAFDAEGRVVVSGTLPQGYSGAGVPAYVSDTAHTALTQITGSNASYFTEETIFHASPDHKVVGFTAGDISNGPWGTIDTKTATIKLFETTNWFNYDVAAAPGGKYFAVPTYDGTFVANRKGFDIETLGQYATTVFVGAVFDPTRAGILYQSLAGSTTVQAWSVAKGVAIKSYNTGVTIPWGGNGTFPVGYLRAAADGSYLFMKTSAGAAAIPLK
jgi:hypothetical protein